MRATGRAAAEHSNLSASVDFGKHRGNMALNVTHIDRPSDGHRGDESRRRQSVVRRQLRATPADQRYPGTSGGIRVSAAAAGGRLDRPCSRLSTVRTGTRSSRRIRPSIRRSLANPLDQFGGESRQRLCLDPGSAKRSRSRPVLLNFPEPPKNLRSDIAFSYA